MNWRALSPAMAVFLFFACLEPARGQFYAPETEEHDPVQKVAVVEGARVLAGLAALYGTNFSEIAYHVTTRTDSVSWEIHWLDSSGQSAKSAVVSYSPTNLEAGPAFYRTVMDQLWQAGWRGLMPLAPERPRALFWDGAAQMSLSREGSLFAALKIAPATRPADEDWMPQLAGILLMPACLR